MVPKEPVETYSEEETAKRRDAALLRALSTPHKKQAEMKLGKRKVEASGRLKTESKVKRTS